MSEYVDPGDLQPMADYNADDAYEAAINFHREVSSELHKLKIRQAAKDALRSEQVGDVTIPPLTRLDDFLARPIDPVTHRIDGLWPIGGRVILAAQWKAGKTTLRDNVMRSLVDGHTLFGVHHVTPLPGPVILLDFELDEQTLQRWLADQGYQHPERVHVISMKGRVSAFNILDEKLRARWVEMFSAIQPATIMVDCLRPILDSLGLDENHEVGKFLGPLDELVGACGARETFLVHHMGHGSERSRGDSRLRDWPDAEWRLVRDKDEDDDTMDNPSGPRYFSAYGRDVDHPQTELTFDPSTRHLSIGVDAGSRKASSEKRNVTKAMTVILAVVTREPGINKNGLRVACRGEGAGHNPAIDAAAKQLEMEGKLRVVRVGQTHLHYLADPELLSMPTVPQPSPRAQGGTVPRPLGRGTVTTPSSPDEKSGEKWARSDSTTPPSLCGLCHYRAVPPGRGICESCAEHQADAS